MREYIYPMRVHVEDTDFGGIVYHSNYLNFTERARSEWLDEIGFGIEWQLQQEIFFVIRAVSVEYLKPIGVHAKIEVVSKIKTMGKASVTFEHYLRLAADPNKICARAEVKIVCVNKQMQPTMLPDPLRQCGGF